MWAAGPTRSLGQSDQWRPQSRRGYEFGIAFFAPANWLARLVGFDSERVAKDGSDQKCETFLKIRNRLLVHAFILLRRGYV